MSCDICGYHQINGWYSDGQVDGVAFLPLPSPVPCPGCRAEEYHKFVKEGFYAQCMGWLDSSGKRCTRRATRITNVYETISALVCEVNHNEGAVDPWDGWESGSWTLLPV